MKIAGTLFSRGAGTLAQIGFTSLAGNLAGASALGLYFMLTSWASIYATVTSFGVPYAFLKYASIYHEQKNKYRILILIQLSLRVMFISTCIVLAIWTLAVLFRFVPDDNGDLSCLVPIAGVLLLVIRFGSEFQKAIGRSWLSMLPEYSIPPIVGSVALLLWTLFFSLIERNLEVTSVAYTYIVGLGAGSLLSVILIQRYLGIKRDKFAHNISAGKRLKVRDFIPYWATTIANQFFAFSPYIFLAYMEASEVVAQFGVAHRVVALTATINFAIASIQSPKFAVAWAERDWNRVNRIFRQSQIMSIVLYAPFFVISYFWSDYIGYLFGIDSELVGILIKVLAVGRLINSALGIPDHFMLMTEGQNLESRLVWLSLFVLFISFPLGLTLGGVVAASIAYAVAFTFRFLLSYIYSRKGIKALCSNL